MLFGRRRRGPQDQIPESVAGLPDAERRVRVREETVPAAAVGRHPGGIREDTAAAPAQDIVDPGPEERRDEGGRDGRSAAVQRQHAPGAAAAAAGRPHSRGAQVSGGAVRAQQGVSSGHHGNAVRAQTRRASDRHQSQFDAAAAAASTSKPASKPTPAEKDEHTARRAPAEQRQEPGRGRHGHGQEEKEMTIIQYLGMRIARFVGPRGAWPIYLWEINYK